MKRKCATVSVEVRKSQHKYVIGPKGSGIAEILQDSGVSVEMPPTDTDKETITLRVTFFKLFNFSQFYYHSYLGCLSIFYETHTI